MSDAAPTIRERTYFFTFARPRHALTPRMSALADGIIAWAQPVSYFSASPKTGHSGSK